MALRVKMIMFIIALLFFLSISLFGYILFINLGKWLVVKDQLPEKLDLIFVFSWDLKRVKHAKHLSSKYPDAILVFSDPKDKYFTNPKSRYYKKFLSGMNLDTSRIITLIGSENTFEEVQVLKQYLFKHETIDKRIGFIGGNCKDIKINKLKHIGFVSSPLHMKRIQVSIKKELGSEEIIQYILPAPLEEFGYNDDFFDKWWKYKNNKIIAEWVKIVYYFFWK